MSSVVELEIERLGARGDGIARHRGRPVYVPFTAPGDRIRARLGPVRGEGVAAELVEIVEPSQARLRPTCPHFGKCGGCAFQHVADEAYAEAKRQLIVEALGRHRLRGVRVNNLERIPAGTRRRTRFAVHGARIGFQARTSHQVVAISECAVLAPEIVALVPALRHLRGNGAYEVTLAESGLDVIAERTETPLLEDLETLARLAEESDLARLSWRREGTLVPVAQRRPVRIDLAGVAVDLPAGAFLQATRESEKLLTELVVAGVGEARHVADLFAGIGTFTFPLGRHAAVHAVEASAPAITALRVAANRAGLHRVSTETRDLDARPLDPEELARFDAVVFDPPRAGARAQAAALARSRVPLIVAVSCNPATFARDAATLIAGGYHLQAVTPVDQFLWSAHVELVGIFRR